METKLDQAPTNGTFAVLFDFFTLKVYKIQEEHQPFIYIYAHKRTISL